MLLMSASVNTILHRLFLLISIIQFNVFIDTSQFLHPIITNIAHTTPHFRGSIDRLGAYAADPILSTPELVSNFTINRPSRTTPTITENYIYVGNEAGLLYALDRRGMATSSDAVEPVWVFETERPIVSSAVADSNNRLFVGGLDDNVYSLDAETGELINQFKTFGDIYASPLLVNNVLYIGSLDYQLYALNADNLSVIWQTSLDGEIWSSAAWGSDGKIYVGSRSNHIYAIDALSGQIVWQYETGGWVDATPAVYDGKVFVGSHDGNFYALNTEDGSIVWQYDTGQVVYSSAAVNVAFQDLNSAPTEEATTLADTVYVNNFDGEVFAFDLQDGSVKWETTIGGPAYASPVYVDGLLYVITEVDGLLYALDTNFGSPRWTYVTGRAGDFRSASPVPYEDKLYVASNTEGLLVLGAGDDSSTTR
jgi:eukaryotic-like serine/threonine-protein kinase